MDKKRVRVVQHYHFALSYQQLPSRILVNKKKTKFVSFVEQQLKVMLKQERPKQTTGKILQTL